MVVASGTSQSKVKAFDIKLNSEGHGHSPRIIAEWRSGERTGF